MKNPFRRKALTASPEVIASLHDRQTSFIRRLGGTNQRIQQAFNEAQSASYGWFYSNSPAVRTVVDLLASNIGQLDLRLYEEREVDEREPEPDHPAMDSLRYPNKQMSSDQFIRYLVKSFLIFDNAYATKHRTVEDGPLSFVALPPDRVEVGGRGLAPEYYILHYVDGQVSDPIAPADMLHWRGENFADMRIGSSRLETLRSVIAEEAAMQTALYELAKSGLAEPTWVYRPLDAPEWTNEARGRFEEDTSNRLRRANTRPPVMEEGMELRGFGVSPKDAEMLAVRKYALQQVASLYGVPLGMVGLDSNIGAAQSEFYADTLPPLCEALCRQLNLQVLQAEYEETDLYFEFDLDEKMAGDERIKTMTSAAGVPPMTRNEARGRLNLPPVEGGDEPITPLNVQVGGKPSTDVMPIQDPNKPSQEGDFRTEQEPEMPKALPVETSRPLHLSEALIRHYERVATSGKSDPERWNRELAEDLRSAGLNGDAASAAAVINRQLDEALANGDRAEVFNRAKAEAPQMAARWQLQPAQMKELGVPQEVIWERAGFSPAEIDRMRALNLAEELSGSLR